MPCLLLVNMLDRWCHLSLMPSSGTSPLSILPLCEQGTSVAHRCSVNPSELWPLPHYSIAKRGGSQLCTSHAQQTHAFVCLDGLSSPEMDSWCGEGLTACHALQDHCLSCYTLYTGMLLQVGISSTEYGELHEAVRHASFQLDHTGTVLHARFATCKHVPVATPNLSLMVAFNDGLCVCAG